MKTSNSGLKERLNGWTPWDQTMYHVGACLGFWPEGGAPYDHDPWHGIKWVIWSANPLGDTIANFIAALVSANILERRESPDISFRWNKENNLI